ncbi:hypothetical protein THTE_4413 [Thermogutta terrifontis]|uniref:Uncharacterized protein n=1 Tax=Thermogutta terrifontis TaxID=1331910 RepID=A0A286RM23_9BACT|nr:hypothetical protein THTE_4413 [Thermogutta terrifontis]
MPTGREPFFGFNPNLVRLRLLLSSPPLRGKRTFQSQLGSIKTLD